MEKNKVNTALKYLHFLTGVMEEIVALKNRRKNDLQTQIDSLETITIAQIYKTLNEDEEEFQNKMNSLILQYNYFVDKINECSIPDLQFKKHD